jgi:hypothetical protein
MWRKQYNKTTGNDEYVRSVLPVKCKWRSRENSVATETGAINKRYVTVVVPYENGYTFPGKIGDYMALGAHRIEITGKKPNNASDVKELLSPDFMQVQYIKDSTHLSVGKRWKVEGIL